MERRERYHDPQEAMRAALDGQQSSIWTALPGLVTAFNPVAVTVSVQPAIKGQVRGPDGKTALVDLPLLVDVPVMFARGGGLTATFPIAAGDECLVVFAARCIDGWWQDGGVQPALDQRMHDLSDGFAFVGPMSQKRRISNISTTAAQLRTDDGATFVSVAAGQVTIKAAAVTLDTPLVTVTGDVVASGKSLVHHRHPGDSGGTTGEPL